MSNTAMRTYQTRISRDFEQPLMAYAALMAQVEHSLFADRAAGQSANKLKSLYLVKFGITARQFNAARVRLEGKIDSIAQLLSQRIETKKEQIQSLEKKLQRLKSKKILHQKKRRLAQLKYQLRKLETARSQKKTSLCFGSKKLFRAQFDLDANGYANHAQWRS